MMIFPATFKTRQKRVDAPWRSLLVCSYLCINVWLVYRTKIAIVSGPLISNWPNYDSNSKFIVEWTYCLLELTRRKWMITLVHQFDEVPFCIGAFAAERPVRTVHQLALSVYHMEYIAINLMPCLQRHLIVWSLLPSISEISFIVYNDSHRLGSNITSSA